MNEFIRTAYNYDMNAASDEAGLMCLDPSLAKQSFAEEADINTIVRRFNITGELPVGVRMPTYGDFDTVSDFQEAMNAIALAREAFDRMPAEVRARFNNDPQKFVEFTSDDNNIEEARKLGLVPAAELAAAAALATPPTPAPASPAAPLQAPPGPLPVGGSVTQPT